MTRPLLLALAFVAAAEGSAQPSLIVSADTVRYPAETTFTATNGGPDSLSLSFPITHDGLYGTTLGYGWSFEVETPDSLYDFVYLPFDEPPTIPLPPSAPATFRILGFDPCPVCGDGGPAGGLPADTLYLRSATASGADTTHVVLDLAGFVSAEPTATGPMPLRLSAYPNPARQTLTVVVESERAAAVNLFVFDVLGREVQRERVPAAGQAFVLDLGGLWPGVYVLQARGASSGVATTRFVVVR